MGMTFKTESDVRLTTASGEASRREMQSGHLRILHLRTQAHAGRVTVFQSESMEYRLHPQTALLSTNLPETFEQGLDWTTLAALSRL